MIIIKFIFWGLFFYVAFHILSFIGRVFAVKREIDKRYQNRYNTAASSAPDPKTPHIRQEDIIDADFVEIKEDKEEEKKAS
jgi:hypothetical protein